MRSIRVLFVEDLEIDGELVRRFLARNFNLLDFERVDNESGLLAQLRSKSWDVVLSDYNIPGFSAQEALAYVREKDEHLPFILVSGAIGEEATVEILKFGADDVVLKNNLARLTFSIDRVMRESRFRENEAQAKRTAERAVRAREQMLTVVSHDLRNPLGAIQLNAETIKKKIESAGDLQEARNALVHIESIVRSSLRMKGLIADLLDKVRLESGSFAIHPTWRDLGDFMKEVEEIFAPLAAEKKLDFALLGDAHLIEANLDYERLYQVLSNLIGNAIKFTPGGGRVRVETRSHEKEIEFRVSDTGPGIASDHLDKIFQKYWQDQFGNTRGVGLGLSIAKDLVKAHGGRIWVESELGKGTSFGFYIPASWREKAHPGLEHEAGNRRICLVDDDDDLREILEENLRELGYEVSSFADGGSAVESLKADPQLPDLMILDYRLPDMTGGEVVEKLRPDLEERKVPVIFLSAEANLLNLAHQHQASAFLTKPLRLRDLSKTIQKLL